MESLICILMLIIWIGAFSRPIMQAIKNGKITWRPISFVVEGEYDKKQNPIKFYLLLSGFAILTLFGLFYLTIVLFIIYSK